MAKRGILEHPKTIGLAELLDIPECYAVGLLECLWHHVARYFPHGEVSKLKPSVLARSIRYPGDGQVLWDALLATGFLDVGPGGAVVVHDWSEHADNAVHQLLKKRGESFADGHTPFTRARVREVNRSEESLSDSQTVHETFTNGSGPPRAVPEPEPEPKKEERLQSLTTGDEEAPQALPRLKKTEKAELESETMPDGTRRLTGAELRALEGMQQEFTRAVILPGATARRFRELFAAGLTVALLDEAVRESAAMMRRSKPDWRAGSLAYFVPVAEKALEDVRETAPPANPPRRPGIDPELRSNRRAALLKLAFKGREEEFRELSAAWVEQLRGAGWSEPDAAADLAEMERDIRFEVRSVQEYTNGRTVGNLGGDAGRGRRPDAAHAKPADPGG